MQNPSSRTVSLTPEEVADIAPIFSAFDASRDGYVQGMAAAKKIILDQLISRRPAYDAQSEPVDVPAEPPSAATGAPDAQSGGSA